MATESTSVKKHRPAKKPYERPQLEVYGNIRKVTEAAGRRGMRDGGRGRRMNRTG